MSNVIHLFMWGYQSHFRANIEHLAERLFDAVLPEVRPSVLLIGVRAPGSDQAHPVCVEPEDGPLDVQRFDGVLDAIEERIKVHPLNDMFYGDEPRMRDKPKNIRNASIREVVEARLTSYDAEQNTRSFVASPVRQSGYDVLCVLQVDARAFDARPHLNVTQIDDRYGVVRSFQEALVIQILSLARTGLTQGEAGRFSLDPPSDEEILRKSGELLMMRVGWATKQVYGLGGLYQACMNISGKHYEGEESTGRMIVCRKGHPKVDVMTLFRQAVALKRASWARKAVELASGDVGVMSDGYEIFGLGRVDSGYEPADEDLFEIRFGGYLKWDLVHGGTVLLRVKDGVPSLPQERLSQAWFCQNLRRVITGETTARAGVIWKIVEGAMATGHGTMIVIAPDAAEEATRLAAQAWPIEPTALSPNAVARLTGIDGAVLIDPSCICHAFGVILDGLASPLGTPAKGARYNSAVRYVAARPGKPTIAIVVSEDGDVSVFPALRDQISHTELQRYIALAQAFSSAQDETQAAWDVLTWFDDHRFYLDASTCELANQHMAQLRGLRQKAGLLWLDRGAFAPHPDMNGSYFLEEGGPLDS